MSIHIDDIYCNHWLKNDKLKSFCSNIKYHSFYPNDVHTSFHIKDSIHYNSLINNNFDNYDEYIKTTEQQDHSVEIFKNLYENFDINKMKKIRVIYNYQHNKYIIHDGLHRLSILLFKNLINDYVPTQCLEIINNHSFYFVIYDHGIEHTDNICNIIEEANIRIDKKIHSQIPTNHFIQFIMDVYPDTNKTHVLAKNNFIINNSRKKNVTDAVILLTSINKWTVMDDKCKEIEMVKRKIRNMYNPKFNNIDKQILPLNKGVSHDHVIHSTDFPNEFHIIYNILDKYRHTIIIDLFDFFKDMKDYTIMKMDNKFPLFDIGKDDVDVLCLDIDKTMEHIISVLEHKYKKYNYRIIKEHNQLDIMYNNKFIIKFDLFNSLSNTYSSYNIPEQYTKDVINNSILKNKFKIPVINDELTIRFLEYDKWIKSRPDKIKHLKYIQSFPDVKYTVFNKK